MPPPSFLVVCCCLGRGWSGPAWRGCLARKLRLAGLALYVWGWLVVVLCGVGNTPACGGLLRLLWSWWSVVVGVPGACWCACVGVACCRGSGAVRPGCLARFFCFSVCWRGGGGCGWVGCELYSGREHLTVSLRQVFCRVLLFVFLSVRWMPWHQGPMKDVVACDIPRGAGWRAVIRGFPNGGTRHELCRVTCI